MVKDLQNIKVSPLKKSDYEDVREVDLATQIQYLGKKWFTMLHGEKESHLVTRKEEFELNLNTGYCFVAELGAKTLGFVFAYQALPFIQDIRIHHIAILPEFQGKGIGILLYKALIKKAKKNGIKKIEAFINIDNPRSMKLHEKLGFALKDRKEAILIL